MLNVFLQFPPTNSSQILVTNDETGQVTGSLLGRFGTSALISGSCWPWHSFRHAFSLPCKHCSVFLRLAWAGYLFHFKSRRDLGLETIPV